MDAPFALISKKSLLVFLGIIFLLLSSEVVAAPINGHSVNPVKIARGLILQPQVVRFEDVVAGQTYTQKVVLTNTGHSAVGVRSVSVSNPRFRIRGLAFPAKLAPGQSVTAEVAFSPVRKGQMEANFKFITNWPEYLVLRANGNLAPGGVLATPQNLNFGNLQIGSARGLPLTIVNTSHANRTISRVQVSGSGFGIGEMNLPMMLSPGESFTFNAIFTPHSVGTASGTIVAETAGLGLTVTVSGQGSESPHLISIPSQFNFGGVPDGKSAMLGGTLRAGTSPVTVYSAGITSVEFALAGLSFPFTIRPGQSKNYQVTFTPTSSGSASGVLSFQTTSAFVVQEALSGNAVASVQHRVTLSWNPAGSGVVGYNIFRADGSPAGYTQINSIPDSNPSYLDSTVQGGHIYYYATTAVAPNGKQSAFSNQVEVSIP